MASRAGGVLPVELTAFGAQYTGSTVVCRWATATETNSAYFVVERSQNARQFTEIGRVAGAGTSTRAQSYSFSDARPLPGTAYYRLRQVDQDGSTAFSPVAVVQSAEQAAFTVVPNPGVGAYELGTSFREPARLQGTVLNLLGQPVVQFNQEVAAGNVRTPFTLEGQPAGVYLVQLVTPGGPVTLRVVKQ
ncbi:T9SS type A sorting domain-containing protein [Hymenobacter cellulosilyticus]|uniref:T9SS type A sorting domain-containing protein n=1 Tax=Hymenobacter cellulosilyticus TaxID=2932248 RepID=A0A8T9QAW7_9BACT|nr:T9SS type A sorting domain-containing protein [Hymenobacter cellulosilyticus]UOQ72950.1 T9SS type A sorting domain-containing protein [Hymenobacter cellulosilyticus]